MTVQVVGNLTTPLGAAAPFVVIRFTAQTSEGNVVESAVGEVTTTDTGAYDFNLDNAQYTIEVHFSDTYIDVAEVVVDDHTPSPIDLADLVRYSTPVIPPTIIPGNVVFEDLVNDLRTDVDTVSREDRDQIADGNVSVAEVKTITTNDRLDAQMAEVQYQTEHDTAVVRDSSLAYKNNVNQEGVYRKIDMATESGNAVLQTEIDEQSAGGVTVRVQDELNTPNTQHSLSASSNDTIVAYTRNTKVHAAEHGESTFLAEDSAYTQNQLRMSDATKVVNHTGSISASLTHPSPTGTIIDAPITTVDEFRQITKGADTLTSSSLLTLEIDGTGTPEASLAQSMEVNGNKLSVHSSNDGVTSTHKTIADTVHIADQAGTDVLLVNTFDKEITVNGKLRISNPDDFKGEAGTVLYHEYQYSQDNAATDPWHDVFDYTVDKWRRQREVTGTADSPVYGSWSTGTLLVAQDGHAGDTIYIEYQYSSDLINWHTVMVSGDIWRRERTVENGTPTSSWSAETRIRGFDGAEGVVTQLQYQYAIDPLMGVGAWHDNFTTGDFFRRERAVVYANDADYQAGTILRTGPWQNVAQIVPIAGVDYGIKQTTVFLYQRGSTSPAPPSGDLVYDFTTLTISPTSNLNGWSTTIPAGTDDVYIAIAVATSIGDVSDPIQPSEWDITRWSTAGFNNATITMYQRVPTGSPDPVPPTHNLTWDFATGAWITGSDLQGWSMTIPAGTDKIWGCLATAYASTATDVVTPADWFLSDQGAVGLNQANMVIYQRAPTQPAAPTADATYNFTTGDLSGLTGGWLNTPPSGTDPLWIGVATAISYNTTDTIGTAEWQISKLAEDGRTVVTSNLFVVSTTTPAIGFTQCNQTIADNTVTFAGGVNPTGWTAEVPPNTAPEGQVWQITSVQVALSGATEVFHTAADYSTPVVVSKNGATGADGTDGRHGQGSFNIRIDTIPATDAAKDAAVAAIAQRPAQDGDLVNFYWDVTGAEYSSWFYRGSTTPDVWDAATFVVDGDAVIDGTLAATKLQADTITGREINAQSTITVGSTSGIWEADLTVAENLGVQWGYQLGAPYGFGDLSYTEYSGAVITGIYSDVGKTTITLSGTSIGTFPATLTLTVSGTPYVFNRVATSRYETTTQLFNAGSVGTVFAVSMPVVTVPIAGMSGDDTGTTLSNEYKDIRFWSGSELPRDSGTGAVVAPFAVDAAGKLYATNADIQGNITATSGTFTGTIQGSDIRSGNLRIPATASTTSGTFINDAGELYAENGTFRGTVYAEHMEGDVYVPVFESNNGFGWPASTTAGARDTWNDFIYQPERMLRFDLGVTTFARGFRFEGGLGRFDFSGTSTETADFGIYLVYGSTFQRVSRWHGRDDSGVFDMNFAEADLEYVIPANTRAYVDVARYGGSTAADHCRMDWIKCALYKRTSYASNISYSATGVADSRYT